SQDYRVNVFLRQQWNDPRLAYREYPDDSLDLDPSMLDSIWKPDLFFANEKGANFHEVTTDNKLLRIFKNGNVLYSIRLTLILSCPMDLKNFPMDIQTCTMQLESFGYTMNDLIFEWLEEQEAVQVAEGLTLPHTGTPPPCSKHRCHSSACTPEIPAPPRAHPAPHTSSPPCPRAGLLKPPSWSWEEAGGICVGLAGPGLPLDATLKHARREGHGSALSPIPCAHHRWSRAPACSPEKHPASHQALSTTGWVGHAEPQAARPAAPAPAGALADSLSLRQEEELVRESRFYLRGYGLGQCLQPKDGAGEGPSMYSPPPATLLREGETLHRRYIDRAKRIDTISRAVFPFTFLVFNIFYWVVYKVLRSEDIHLVP
ncbi:GLRA4 protein, partial [Mionectes macconnelli]|nr:GLRA4 protein [Mionectes macconnelli]